MDSCLSGGSHEFVDNTIIMVQETIKSSKLSVAQDSFRVSGLSLAVFGPRRALLCLPHPGFSSLVERFGHESQPIVKKFATLLRLRAPNWAALRIDSCLGARSQLTGVTISTVVPPIIKVSVVAHVWPCARADLHVCSICNEKPLNLRHGGDLTSCIFQELSVVSANFNETTVTAR